MSDTPSILVDGVTKRYAAFASPADRLFRSLAVRAQRWAGRETTARGEEFEVLSNVSLSVARGETVGIVGRNGAGKSTLLQIICGTLRPTSGSVAVDGRIAALLELGSGFNPDYTGRENVFLNSAILGLSRKETTERFEQVTTFADIGEYIDQPLSTYSSGMYVRLAFSVAIHADPEILIVDEALSVGDEAFQRKCFARIEKIKAGGATILFVSHSAQSVLQLCDKAILLDRGEKLLEADPKTVIGHYQRLLSVSGEEAAAMRSEIRSVGMQPAATDRKLDLLDTEPAPGTDGFATQIAAIQDPNDLSWLDPSLKSESRLELGEGGAVTRDIFFTRLDGQRVNVLSHGIAYRLNFAVEFEQTVPEVVFGAMFKTVNGIELGGIASGFYKDHVHEVRAGQTIQVSMEFICSLNEGVYFINIGIGHFEAGEPVIIRRILDAAAFRVMSEGKSVFSGPVNFGISYQVWDASSPDVPLINRSVPRFGAIAPASQPAVDFK